MSIYSASVVADLLSRGFCAEVVGEMVCQQKAGHFPETPHKDGNGEWDDNGSWCIGCSLSDFPHEHLGFDDDPEEGGSLSPAGYVS